MSRFIWWKTGQLSHWVNDVTLPQWSFDLSSKLKMRTWQMSPCQVQVGHFLGGNTMRAVVSTTHSILVFGLSTSYFI